MTASRPAPKFGTDGVRGVANTDLTVELALAIGRSAAQVLRETATERSRWLIGRDTRQSGAMLTAALAAGLASQGVDVIDLGVLPTPGVAFASAMQTVPAAMISASHNPFADNGIKLFAPGGRKLDDVTEQRLEAQLARDLVIDATSVAGERPRGTDVGTVIADPGAADGYEEHLAGVLAGRRLDGLRVIVDCANGAASSIAPRVLRGLGAEVTVIHAQPDGSNINAGCGSTYPQELQEAVRVHGADVGLALDGDADRVLTVDATGALIDGDHLIAMCAIDLHERGELHDDTVVVTVMTNLGFRLGMEAHGIRVVETAVGDRAVFAAMEAGHYSLGGEQSGHVIFRDVASTGDGVLTGLWVLDLVKRSGLTLAKLAGASMTRLPQVLVNVAVARPHTDVVDLIGAQIESASTALGDRGRVLVRASGTEPLVRVMVEAPTQRRAEEVAAGLVSAVELACST